MDDLRKSFFVAAVGFVIVVVLPQLSYTTAQPHFSDWAVPVPLAEVNSVSNDRGPALSKNGLSLYFDSNRPDPTALGAFDIWVSQRNSVDEPWGPPVNLGSIINTNENDVQPNLSRDGHWLFFSSSREGGVGGMDVWMSYREHVHDDFDWQPPFNPGSPLNSLAVESNPGFLESDDTGTPQLFLSRGGFPLGDIYVSDVLPNGTFGPARPVSELNGPSLDGALSVRFDGLEAFFLSTRPLGIGNQDLWTATRKTVFDPWSVPTNLKSLVNSALADVSPHIASDSETLYFASNRGGGIGGLDLYVTTRTKKKQNGK